MRKEKGGKKGRKKMDEREKEGEVQEMMDEVTEEGIEELEERPEAIEEAVEEEKRCEEDLECHSSAKRARVCATFTDSQEISIVEFVKQHPELYDKEHPHFHNKNKREALWAEISAELKLQPFDVRRWFESQRTRFVKLPKLQSGQAPREITKRQFWVSIKPTSDERGPTEVQDSRPVPTPASRTNLMDLVLIQNTLSPVS